MAPLGVFLALLGFFWTRGGAGFFLALFGFSGLLFFCFFLVFFGTLQVGYRFCKKFVDTALWAPVARKILNSKTGALRAFILHRLGAHLVVPVLLF